MDVLTLTGMKKPNYIEEVRVIRNCPWNEVHVVFEFDGSRDHASELH